MGGLGGNPGGPAGLALEQGRGPEDYEAQRPASRSRGSTKFKKQM